MDETAVPGHILVDAVKAGLRLVLAVAGQVEGEETQGLGSLSSRGRDLDELKGRGTQRARICYSPILPISKRHALGASIRSLTQ